MLLILDIGVLVLKDHIIAIITHLAYTKQVVLETFHVQHILSFRLLIQNVYVFTLNSLHCCSFVFIYSLLKLIFISLWFLKSRGPEV